MIKNKELFAGNERRLDDDPFCGVKVLKHTNESTDDEREQKSHEKANSSK